MIWKFSIVLFFLTLIVVFPGAFYQAHAPEQPVAFSHKIHAGDFKIACEYCHVYARRAAVAGIPSIERCMGCHKITGADKPGVQKLRQQWNQKERIQWIRVNGMPDIVYFEHWPHVRAEVACQTCHGAIETMGETVRARELTMGDCLSCHREKKASLDCLVCHR